MTDMLTGAKFHGHQHPHWAPSDPYEALWGLMGVGGPSQPQMTRWNDAGGRPGGWGWSLQAIQSARTCGKLIKHAQALQQGCRESPRPAFDQPPKIMQLQDGPLAGQQLLQIRPVYKSQANPS